MCIAYEYKAVSAVNSNGYNIIGESFPLPQLCGHGLGNGFYPVFSKQQYINAWTCYTVYLNSYLVRVAKLDDVISMEKSETIKTTARNNNLVLMFCQPSVTKIRLTK